MNILFLTMSRISDISEHDIYQDLTRDFIAEGHTVYLVTPSERRLGKKTILFDSHGCKILRVQIGNQSNCSFIEKGISTLTLRSCYSRAVKKHLKGIRFDLILYSTPPITIEPIVRRLKKQFGCTTYLMLKDIFPQNAVDLGLFSSGGVLHRFFRRRERALYRCSDYIGCMSEANIKYLLSHNQIDGRRVELCPNAIDCDPLERLSEEQRAALRRSRSLPEDKIIMIYGGNLGRPQGIPCLAKCFSAAKEEDDFFFLVIGEGSEYDYLKRFIEDNELTNVKLIDRLPRAEYFEYIRLADIGLICLDERFTIPNFPSRILPYMESALPVFCIADKATDIGKMCTENGFGWETSAGDESAFLRALNTVKDDDHRRMGMIGRRYAEEHFSAAHCCRTILDKCKYSSLE